MTTTQKTKTRASGKRKSVPDGQPAAKRQKQKVPVKFDSDGFKLMGGVGISVAAIGALVVWAAQTSPEGVSPSSSLTYSVSKQIIRSMPQSTLEWIATVLGGLFILFGVFCIAMAIKIVIQYFVEKAKE